MSQINSTNFFRWFTGDVIDEAIPFPRLGKIDAKVYLPQLVAGETAGFYINADIPFYDADDFTRLNLNIIDTQGNTVTVGGGPGILQKIPLALGYRICASFALPNLISGQYQFSIFNLDTSTIKCISNYFQVISSTDADLYTAKVKWRNGRDAYYYDWSQVPDFYCELRLNLSLASYQPDETIDQTKAVSTGIRRNNNYDTDLSYKLNTYYFDDGANLACIPLFKADTLILNDKNYIQKTAYMPNARAASGVSIGEVELYDQYFSTINKFGQLPQQITYNTLLPNSYTILNNSADYLDIFIGVTGGGATNIKHLEPNGIFQVASTTLDSTKYITLSYADTDPLTTMAAIFVNAGPGYSRTTSNVSPATPFGNVTYSDLQSANFIMVFGTVNAVRATAWRGQVGSKVCVTSGGVNTGDSMFTILEQYYTDTSSATGVTKANVNTDPDYIAPAADPTNCATSTYQSIVFRTGLSSNVCGSASTVTGYAGIHATLYAIGTKLFSDSGLSVALPDGFYADGDNKLTVTAGQVSNIQFCSSSH